MSEIQNNLFYHTFELAGEKLPVAFYEWGQLQDMKRRVWLWNQRVESMIKSLHDEDSKPIFRVRVEQKKARGKKPGQTIYYPEYFMWIEKLPFDTNEEYDRSLVQLRVSSQDPEEADIKGFPYFIAKGQCWYWLNRENPDEEWFYDDIEPTDPKKRKNWEKGWKRGEYDRESFEWNEVK